MPLHTGRRSWTTAGEEFLVDGSLMGGDTGATVVIRRQGNAAWTSTARYPHTVQMQGNDGIMAWGTFTDSSSLLTHFVAGLPVPSADLTDARCP